MILGIIKHIFFDFDGVIVESLNAKTEAFYELYLPYGKTIADEVVKYHIQNLGISRYEKIRNCHKKLLKSDISEVGMEILVKKFSDLVVENVINAPLVDGVKKILDKYHSKINMMLISSTPQDELQYILKKMGLRNFFSLVCGSPKSKSFWLKHILKTNLKIKKDNCLFIGDTIYDFYSARENSLPFALRLNDFNKDLRLSLECVTSFDNFTEFESKLKNNLSLSA